jgi:hypothetical protein
MRKVRRNNKRALSFRPAKPDEENPCWTEEDFAKAKRARDIPELAHLLKEDAVGPSNG